MNVISRSSSGEAPIIRYSDQGRSRYVDEVLLPGVCACKIRNVDSVRRTEVVRHDLHFYCSAVGLCDARAMDVLRMVLLVDAHQA